MTSTNYSRRLTERCGEYEYNYKENLENQNSKNKNEVVIVKEYQYGKVTIRIHDANIDPLQRRKQLETAVIKIMKEVMKNESISTSDEST